MSRAYRPKKSYAKWREGAPEFVLDVFDNKGRTADRYTVLLGGSHWDASMGRTVAYLGMNDNPTSPNGFSQWGDCAASWRPSQDRIRWLDLPEHIRKHVTARCEEDETV